MLICQVIEILFYISWLRHELDQIMFCQVNNIPLEKKAHPLKMYFLFFFLKVDLDMFFFHICYLGPNFKTVCVCAGLSN